MNHRGEIVGGDAMGRAIALAGVLAEQGAESLTLRSHDGEERELRAREADLPGLIAGAKAGAAILWRERELEIVIGTDALAWRTSDEEMARAMRAAVVYAD